MGGQNLGLIVPFEGESGQVWRGPGEAQRLYGCAQARAGRAKVHECVF